MASEQGTVKQIVEKLLNLSSSRYVNFAKLQGLGFTSHFTLYCIDLTIFCIFVLFNNAYPVRSGISV